MSHSDIYQMTQKQFKASIAEMQKEQQGTKESPLSLGSLNTIFKQGTTSITYDSHSKLSVSLYRQDYLSLLPHRWLRTSALDLLLKLKLLSFQNQLRKIYAHLGEIDSEAHDHKVTLLDGFVATMLMMNQEDEVLMSLGGLGLFEKGREWLLIPMNTEWGGGEHWILGVLGHTGKGWELWMFDSGGSGGKKIGEALAKQLARLYHLLEQEEMKIEVKQAVGVPKQDNSFDCGVYTVAYAQYFLAQVLQSIQNKIAVNLTRMLTHYKHIIGNSTLTRQKYRRQIQQALLGAHHSQ